MDKDKEPQKNRPHTEFSRKIGMKETQKLQAKQESLRTIWSGFAMFGMIGWSVVVPMLVGIFVGKWLDEVYPIQLSWTLVLLEAGLIMGCINAWHWVVTEQKKIRK